MTDCPEEPRAQHAGPTGEQLSADIADLRDAVGSMAELVTAAQDLPEFLAEVASFAVRGVPRADGAGVVVLRTDGPSRVVEAMAASDPLTAELDRLQCVQLNEGPWVTVAVDGCIVRSGSLGGDMRWPRFGPRVGRLGMHSLLSLPLLLSGSVVGVITVYAHDKDVFDDHAAQMAALFAAPAAAAVRNAQALSEAMTLVDQLQHAMSTRPAIDQAIGLIRGRRGISADEAFTVLRRISQNEHRKLAEVAQQVVDEAVRRARVGARQEQSRATKLAG